MNILIIPLLFYNTIVVNTSILSYANDPRHNIALPRSLLGLVILKKFDTIRYWDFFKSRCSGEVQRSIHPSGMMSQLLLMRWDLVFPILKFVTRYSNYLAVTLILYYNMKPRPFISRIINQLK